MKKSFLTGIICLLSIVISRAQLSGLYNVPSSYTSVAAAIDALNTLGVSSSVTIEINAGYTETVTVGGFTLNSVTGASSVNRITFTRTGIGANPILYAYAGGTCTPATAVQDGVWRLVGADYITIDGIDINDPNTSNPSTMEFGIGLFKVSAADGCQNNIIRNCVITLNKINNTGGTGPATDGSRGIDIVNALQNAHTTAVTVTASTGANSNNSVRSNTIQNCNIGIAVIGYAASSPFTNSDTGNDIGGNSVATGNIILNFGGGGTTAAAGLRTLAQQNFNASFNTVINNNGAGTNHAGVLRGLFINTATSANVTANSNTIVLHGGGTTQQVAAIDNAAGSTAATNTLTFNNNVIINCTYTTATSGIFNAIQNGGSASVVIMNGNLVNNISLSGTGTSVILETGSPLSATANSNTITNITRTGASGSFRIIKTTSPDAVVANNNLIDNISWTNLTSTGSIDVFSSPNSAIDLSVNNNIVRNISVPTSGTINGIRENGISGIKSIQGNQFYNFSTTAGGVGGGTFNGIFTSVGTVAIANNTIYAINSTGTTGGAGGSVNGIQVSGGTVNNINGNRIYDISSTSTAAVVSGIYLNGGTTNNVYNNLIADLRAPAAIGTNVIMGINVASGTSNVYYNTVHLNATSSATLSGTSALFASTSPNLNLRNNVLVNISVRSGTAVTAAYRRSSTTLTTYSATSNNNLLYASVPSSSTVIFADGTNTYSTLALYKTLVSTRDVASVTEAPPFLSLVGSNVNFLKPDGTIPTQIEAGAAPLTGITTDYAGTLRNSTTPDIGAWEGNYTLLDATAPAIVYAALSSTCGLSDRSFTATISDLAGVPVTGSLTPRLYFKKNSGAYVSSTGSLVSGSGISGIWSFTISGAALSGVAGGDVIFYYVVAQDVASTPNIGASPGAGFTAADVNNITTHPTSPANYTLTSVLSGSYTVGSGGNFTTLSAAALAYNTSCLSGPVTFQLTDGTYSSAEIFPIVFANNPMASSVNSLLVVPSAAVDASIIGTSTAPSVIKFLDARFINFDGINSGGRSITINGTNTSTASVIWLSASNNVGGGNNSIGLNRMNLIGGSNSQVGNYGIIACVDGPIVSVTPGQDNDNINISGNSIQLTHKAIYGAGAASVSVGGLDNWNVAGNLIGPASSGTNNIGGVVLFLRNAVNVNISANTIRNIQTSATTTIGGINLAAFVTSVTVSQNTINSIKSSGASSGVSAINAILVGPSVTNATVNANVISGIENTHTNGWGARGIIVNTTSNSAVYIQNNTISDIACYTDASAIYWPIGIALEGSSGGVSVDFNSVNLFGTHTGLTNANSSTPLYMNSTGVCTVRNNIFVNTYDNSSSSTDATYAIYSTGTATNFAVINYNNYFAGGSASPALGYQGSALTSIAAIQTALGGNANSISMFPQFVSNTDLHLKLITANVPVHNTGLAITGITTDVDSQVRQTPPDIGADEFTIPTCTTASGGVLSSNAASVCAGQTLAVTSNSVSDGLTTSFQWQVSTTSGGPYANVTGGAGATTTSYTSAVLPPGVYYVVLKTTCANASLTALSNEGTLTVNALPTSSASVASSTLCSGTTLSLTGISNIATTYSWSGPGGFTSTSQNPVITNVAAGTGSYFFSGSAAGCSSSVSAVSVTVKATPGALTVTPTSTLLCAGNSASLMSAGGAIPAVMNFTPQTNQNAASAYPAPYSAYYGGQKMQFLVLASELTANGLAAGPLTAIQFPVVSFGSDWGNSTFDNQGFRVSIGATNLTSVGSAFQTGLTVVASSTNFTPSLGYANMHTFNSPFIWDGVSNIIVETVFSNNNTGSASDAVIQYNSATSFQSTMVYRDDAVSFATIAAATTTNASMGLVRPDFKLHGTGAPLYSWTPALGLSGTTGQTVNATPLATTIYTAIANNQGCTSQKSSTVTVTQQPTLTVVPTKTAVCAGESVSITASGAPSYTWNTQSNQATIVDNPSVNTTYTVSGFAAPCPVVSNTISIVANALPVVTVVPTSNSICVGNTATLTAFGAVTYSWDNGSTTQNTTVSPVVNSTYTVTGTDGLGCSASATISIVSNTLPIVTAVTSTSSVCAGQSATLTAGGAATYSWSNGTTTASFAIAPSATTIFTVVGTLPTGCSAAANVSVVVNPIPVLTVTAKHSTICPGTQELFTVTGALNYTWSPATNLLPTPYSHTVLADPSVSTTYTLLANNGFCPASTTTINLVVGNYPLLTMATTAASICETTSATLTGFGAGSYTWMPGNIVSNSIVASPPSTTTYTLIGSNGGTCETNKQFALVVDACTGISENSSLSQFIRMYPNPTSGVLKGEFSFEGQKHVIITNAIGEVITSQENVSAEFSADLSSYAKGIYFVKVISGTSSATFKIILQ